MWPLPGLLRIGLTDASPVNEGGKHRRVEMLPTVLPWAIVVPAVLFALLAFVRPYLQHEPPPWVMSVANILNYPAAACVDFLTQCGVFEMGTLKNVHLHLGILFGWWATLGAGVGVVHYAIRRRRAAWRCRRRTKCASCGYELRGLSEPRCPECGKSFDPVAADGLSIAERRARGLLHPPTVPPHNPDLRAGHPPLPAPPISLPEADRRQR